MGFKGLTVNTDPTAEPHIYAEDDASIYQSILGSDGVLNIGQKFEATVLSNNLVRMADGILCVNGHIGRTAYGLYDDFEISNGQSGVNRNDLIIAKFQTTGTNGIDTYTVEVKQGAAAAEAVDPEIIQEDLYQGGKLREYPLYRVRIEGLSIVAVEPLFKIIPTVPELEERIGELNSEIKSKLSHVGMIIHSTTLNTMAKVIAIYGGTTWKKIEGRFLLGQSSSYDVNSTGGEATHTLTEGEMPAHEHSLKWLGFNDEQTGNTNVYAFGSYGMFRKINLETYPTGNNKPHNNMPPYKTVYIWERTA